MPLIPDDQIESKVKSILETALSATDIQVYQGTASAIITDILDPTSLSIGTKTQIELWLTAHFIASTREVQLEEAGGGDGVEAKYQGRTSFGLSSTHYGQTAMMMDTTGNLKRFSLGRYEPQLIALSALGS